MKQKLIKIIWPIIYLVLIINVCLSFILVFRSYYYCSIFVSGRSMEPTLHGDRTVNDGYVDYGIIDDHKNAINNLKRFQIITTYYPFESSTDYVGGYKPGETNVVDPNSSSYKIKRVYGFPGETIRFDLDDEYADLAKSKVADQYSEEAQFAARKAVVFYVDGVKQDLKFKRKIEINSIEKYRDKEFVLGENEYWVMGDNYSASTDCFYEKKPIYYDNIVGVLIAIEGTCKIESKTHKEVDSTEDGTKSYYECKKRKWHMPVYY